MGQYVNILVFQKEEHETVVDFSKQLFAKLSFKVKRIVAERDFNTTYTEMFFDSSQQYRVMVGRKDNFVILMEEGDCLVGWDRLHRIMATTKNNDKMVYWMMTSDTVDIMLYSFYKSGKVLRSVEYGDDGIKDVADDEPTLVGEPLPYEKDGLFAFEVLKNYCHDYHEFSELEWHLFEVDDEMGR